jgi:hypothetical protein
MDVFVDLSGYEVPEEWAVILGPGYIVHGDFPGDKTYRCTTPMGWLVNGEFISVDKCPPGYKTKKEDKFIREYKAEDFKPENLGAEILYLLNAQYQNVTKSNLPAEAYRGSLESLKELLGKAEVFYYNQGVKEGLVRITAAIVSIKDEFVKQK